MKLIDKAAIVTEIERRINEYNTPIDRLGSNNIRLHECKDILSFLNTFEVKEINNMWNNASDFPKAEVGRSILLIEDNGHAELLKSPSAERLFYFRPTNLKMWAYIDELLSITTHLDVKDVDLKNSMTCNVDWYDGFLLDYTQEQQDTILKKLGVNVGDKVRVILIKE